VPGGTLTTTAANKELVRRLYGGLAKGDTAVAEEVLAEGYLDHDIPGVGQGGGQELVAAVPGVRAAFSDIAPMLGPILAEGAWLPSGSRRTAATPAPHSHPASLPPASPSLGRKSTFFRCAVDASPKTGNRMR
jgi:hypothetical protein